MLNHRRMDKATVLAWHTRTVLRRIYRLKWHRRMTEPNHFASVVLHVAPPNMTAEQAARYHRYHGSDQHGR